MWICNEVTLYHTLDHAKPKFVFLLFFVKSFCNV